MSLRQFLPNSSPLKEISWLECKENKKQINRAYLLVEAHKNTLILDLNNCKGEVKID